MRKKVRHGASSYVINYTLIRFQSSIIFSLQVVDIAIFDATNTTLERRRWLKTSLKDQEAATGVKFQLVFIESVCTDEAIIRANVRETKLKSPDYKDMPEDVAVADFLARIRHYKSVYQPISEDLEGDLPYIKLVDVGRVLVANRINGALNEETVTLNTTLVSMM